MQRRTRCDPGARVVRGARAHPTHEVQVPPPMSAALSSGILGRLGVWGMLTAATAFTRKDAFATTLFRTAKAAVGRARSCTCGAGAGGEEEQQQRQYHTVCREPMHVTTPCTPYAGTREGPQNPV